jgi:hypothetical protein
VRHYGRCVPELWFFLGLVIGIVMAGFSAIGSFERGADSVRKAPWRLELATRRAVTAHRAPAHGAAQRLVDERTSVAV